MMMPGMGVPANMVQIPAMLAQMQQQQQHQPEPASPAVASGGKHKPPFGARFKKAPDAPKRFKSAFIIFSAEKHREIKEKYATEGRTEKVSSFSCRNSESFHLGSHVVTTRLRNRALVSRN